MPGNRLLSMGRAAAGATARAWPLTGLGLVSAASAAGVYVGFAAPRQDYVVQLVCLLVLALVAAAVVVMVPSAAWLRHLRRRPAPAADVVFEAVRGVGTGLEMPRPTWPLSELGWTWHGGGALRAAVERRGSRLVEVLTSDRRAWLERVERRWTVEDAFGLARHGVVDVTAQRVEVLPWTGRLDLHVVLRALADGEEIPHPSGAPHGDRADMRRYGPGDPIRLVMWKVYARTGQLVVRTPERALSPTLRVAAYLPACPNDEAAAAAARVAVESGILGPRWLLGTDGVEGAADEVDGALERICRSAAFAESAHGNGAGLDAFAAHARSQGARQLLLLLPPSPGPWLERCARAIRAWNGRCVAVVVCDAVETADDVSRRRWDRVLRHEGPVAPPVRAATTADLQAICEVLAHAGAEPLVLERPGGRTVPVKVRAVRRAA